MVRRIALALTLLLLSSLAATVACGGGGGDNGAATKTPGPAASREPSATSTSAQTPGASASPSTDAEAIDALVRAQTAANNNKDIDGFLVAFADSYFTDEIHVSREEARGLVAQFIGVPKVVITKIPTIGVTGDTAEATVDSNEGVIVSSERYHFVRQNGQWRITSVEELPVTVEGARVVDLTLSEYAFQFDASQISQGGYAFNVTNAGTQSHEVELLKLPEGTTAQELVDPKNEPAGAETVGLFGPLDPGKSATLAFAEDLPSGSYAMVCYLPDPSGTLHSQLGMLRLFTAP
jgi:hypothetical protein